MNVVFNPLTDGLSDLRLTHDHCWLWPQISPEFDRLENIVENARVFLEPLTTRDAADWAVQAGFGVARSNAAIHQQAERYGSYSTAARSLWTTRIPPDPPTFSDVQIHALLAIQEARLAAETYADLAAGIEEEIEQGGVGHDAGAVIDWLRAELAGWERYLWRDAAEQTGAAEKFLLLAAFAASDPDPAALRQAESDIAQLRGQANAAAAVVAAYRQGRQKGAVGRLSRALSVITREAGSKELEDVLRHLREVLGEDIQGIRFDDLTEEAVWFTDLVKNAEKSIAIDSLRRKLQRFPDS